MCSHEPGCALFVLTTSPGLGASCCGRSSSAHMAAPYSYVCKFYRTCFWKVSHSATNYKYPMEDPGMLMSNLKIYIPEKNKNNINSKRNYASKMIKPSWRKHKYSKTSYKCISFSKEVEIHIQVYHHGIWNAALKNDHFYFGIFHLFIPIQRTHLLLWVLFKMINKKSRNQNKQTRNFNFVWHQYYILLQKLI